MTTALEVRTMRKVYLHLLPFTFALYLICYLDRANIGFAARNAASTCGVCPA
jgi:ACS family tartrate transporter-like MFS transporter